MDFDCNLPDSVPGMTLPDVVLFPQATMPLFIFEPRYRKMLADSLDGDRLMLVATQDNEQAKRGDAFEPYHKMATLGLIQSSQKNEDGTSSILVQGLIRVNIVDTLQEDPYRIFAINPIPSEINSNALCLQNTTEQLIDLIKKRSKLGNRISKEILRFLGRIDDADILSDIVSYTLIPSAETKLQLLQIIQVEERLKCLVDYFQQEIRHLTLIEKLQGTLQEERIHLN